MPNASQASARPATARSNCQKPSGFSGDAKFRQSVTASGVALCAAASILVLFEGRNEILFYWLAAAVFVIGNRLFVTYEERRAVRARRSPMRADAVVSA